MESAEVLALVGGHVEAEILLRNEYLAAENAILKSKLEGRLRFTHEERVRLAKIGKQLGRKALADVGPIVKPDTILKWFRELVAKKFDGSKHRRYPGRPRVDPEVERLVVRFAEANSTWGYDRIQGALANLGYEIADQTVGNILKRNGIPPAPTRSRNTTWADFIRAHADSIVAADFFTAEVLTGGGPVTFYVLFFIHLASRRVRIAGITEHPDEKWMMPIARNETMVDYGFLDGRRYLIHDRDGKFCPAFRRIIKDAGVEPLKLPARSPNLNPVAERWVKSVKTENLSRLVLFSEDALRRACSEYLRHYHEERNHQSFGNRLLFPEVSTTETEGRINCRERLGGLLKFYHRDAA
jgi:putative transposase